MSSNTQFHVSARERFSLDKVLGTGGANILCEVLQKLSDREYPDEEIRTRLPWQKVTGKERTFHLQVGTHDITLSLQGMVPKLIISGMQSEHSIPESVMQSAHVAVNQVLALAMSDRIAQRLNTFVNERNSQLMQERVSHSVALKALQLQDARLAIRASCQILVRS